MSMQTFNFCQRDSALGVPSLSDFFHPFLSLLLLQVVFVPIWIILTLLAVGVLYYIIWALLFMRSPEISAVQRKAHIINAVMSCLFVIPLLTFMVSFNPDV